MTNLQKIVTIQGIGIDAVEIARFALWHTYSDTKLSRIFSTEEIAYCRACPAKSAERFAARFAAREALYKALCQAYPDEKWLFLTLCKHVKITHGSHGQPELTVNWQNLTHKTIQSSGSPTLHDKTPHILLSLTHTDSLAMAWVVIQESYSLGRT
jgi:phosphopantetheine--protein transferase-like protein